MASVRGGPRSQAARERIVEAARTVFAEVGYDRATVREIASRAAVVPAMLIRYFGGKAGVFAAAIQFDLRLPMQQDADPDVVGRSLAAHFLLRWEHDGDGGDLVALLRASVDHPEARDRMVSVFEAQLVPVIADVTGREHAGVTAALIATQMLGLAFCRYVLGLDELRRIGRDALVERIGSSIAGHLRGVGGREAGARSLIE